MSLNGKFVWPDIKLKKPGSAPGSLIYTGPKEPEPVTITVLDYKNDKFEEKVIQQVSDCAQYKDTPSVSWINVDGLHDAKIIDDIGKTFDIHPLVLEDILNTSQRPKFENHDMYIFAVLRMLYIK
ncbi:MAG: CorA family divalent cation transporter, partial [Nanoarchaeota archaeon]